MLDWRNVLDGLRAAGWEARVVPVERLDEAGRRAREAATAGDFPADVAASMPRWTRVEVPDIGDGVRSAVIAAIARPLTQALLAHNGAERLVRIPPHYAGYHTTPAELQEALAAALAPFGFAAARVQVPLKTLATCAGLARYGSNNVAYVEGFGSYLYLAACASDAPPPADHFWCQPAQLDHCGSCGACRKACPTGAIAGERFLLHTERCLTFHNERTEAVPDWLEPRWHHAAVGCLRCQMVCPENSGLLREAEPEHFDAAETAALLAATPAAELAPATVARMHRCGLDYDPGLIARNLSLLLDREEEA